MNIILEAQELSRKRNLAILVPVLLWVSALSGGVLVWRGIATGAWQHFAVMGFALLSVILYWVGNLQLESKTGGPTASWLIFSAFWLPPLGIVTFYSGLGGLSAGLFTVSSLFLAPQFFKRATVRLGILGTLIGSVILLAVDYLLAPAFRLPLLAQFTQYLPILIGGLVILFFFLLAQQFQFFSIRQKLIISFLFLALLPMSVLGINNTQALRNSLTAAANQSLFSVASQTANNIDEFITTNQSALSIESQLPGIEEYLRLAPEDRPGSPQEAEIKELLYNLQDLRRDEQPEDRTYLKGYFLLDKQGTVLLDTQYSILLENSPTVGTSLGDQAYFLNPMLGGEPYRSNIVITNSAEDASFYISVRITNDRNEPIGVLVTVYDAIVLQDIVTQANGLAGEGSYGVLFDPNNIPLAHGIQPDYLFKSIVPLEAATLENLIEFNRLPNLSGEELFLNFPELDEQLKDVSKNPSFTFLDPTASGAANQVATSRLETYPAWVLAFFQPEEAFLAPVNEQINNTLAITGFIVVAVIVIVIIASNQFARPILNLTKSAEAVAEGNYDVSANISTYDEIGILATTFNKMTDQLRETLGGLERMVQSRTEQVEAINEVGRVASSILDPEELIRQVVNLITDRFGYYYAAIFTVDKAMEWAELQFATGEAGRILKQKNHRLEIAGKSMVGSAITARAGKIALDVGEEAVRFDNPELPETRSEIALPLLVGEQVLGALDVQSTEEKAFNQENIETLQNMANQVAIALANANLFAQTQRGVQTQFLINEISNQMQAALDIESILTTTVSELGRSVGAKKVRFQIDTRTNSDSKNQS